jgi:hypothetical protein
MEAHHTAWLSAHPWRTEGWLQERLTDGFDVHHLDGNHGNNDPMNLVLIDRADHMMLHLSKRHMRRFRVIKERKGRTLYGKPIGPMYHWRFKGIPRNYRLEWWSLKSAA